MTFKRHLVAYLTIILALPVFSQNRENDILSYLISEKAGVADTSKLKVESEAGALDIVIAGSSNHSSALDYIVSTPQNNGLDVLNMISGAYSRNGFYQSGSWETKILNNSPFNSGTLSGLMPDWRTITSGFGYREWNHRMHKGIDIAMGVGDTIRAIMPGVVSKIAFEQKGYGLYIVLQHSNGTETRYAHLSRALVDEGQPVAYGDVVALSGNTGNSTGPHLHFETRVNGVAVNPIDFFNANTDYAANYHISSADMTGDNAYATKRTYIVRQGDTVKTVAKKTGTRVLKLCQLNGLTETEALEPGRMLILR